MFPIRDHNPSTNTPYVTYGLIAVNVVVFLLTWSMDDSSLQKIFMTYGMIPQDVMAGRANISLITHMFHFIQKLIRRKESRQIHDKE